MDIDAGMSALNAFQAVLSDAENGFNPTLIQTSAMLGVAPFTINFDNDPSLKTPNFLLAQIDPELLLNNGTGVNFPLMAMYVPKIANVNKQTGYMFSGTVHLVIDLHLDFPQASAFQNYESNIAAARSALISTVNSVAAQAVIPSNVCYNGNVDALDSTVKKGGRNYLVSLRHVHTLDVNIPFFTF